MQLRNVETRTIWARSMGLLVMKRFGSARPRRTFQTSLLPPFRPRRTQSSLRPRASLAFAPARWHFLPGVAILFPLFASGALGTNASTSEAQATVRQTSKRACVLDSSAMRHVSGASSCVFPPPSHRWTIGPVRQVRDLDDRRSCVGNDRGDYVELASNVRRSRTSAPSAGAAPLPKPKVTGSRLAVRFAEIAG